MLSLAQLSPSLLLCIFVLSKERPFGGPSLFTESDQARPEPVQQQLSRTAPGRLEAFENDSDEEHTNLKKVKKCFVEVENSVVHSFLSFFPSSIFFVTCMPILGVPAPGITRAPTGLRRPPTGINGDFHKEYLENHDDRDIDLSEEVSDDDEKFLAQVQITACFTPS